MDCVHYKAQPQPHQQGGNSVGRLWFLFPSQPKDKAETFLHMRLTSRTCSGAVQREQYIGTNVAKVSQRNVLYTSKKAVTRDWLNVNTNTSVGITFPKCFYATWDQLNEIDGIIKQISQRGSKYVLVYFLFTFIVYIWQPSLCGMPPLTSLSLPLWLLVLLILLMMWMGCPVIIFLVNPKLKVRWRKKSKIWK